MRTAIFDLDGTITRRDTLIAYITGLLARRGPLVPLRLLRAIPAVLAYALHRDRGRLKSAVIRATIGGSTREELAVWTSQFVDRLLRTGVHDDAVNAIALHRRMGDVLALLSASPDLYVPEIGARLGFHEVIFTQLLWHADRLDGALVSENRRGAEKVRCVREIRARYPDHPAVAYGNAASDVAHLSIVDHGVLVNATGKLRREAERRGIECVEWR